MKFDSRAVGGLILTRKFFMAISFTCACGKRLKVSDTLLGKKVKCPDCQKVTLVTAEAPAGAKPAAKPGVPPAKPPVAPIKPGAAAAKPAIGKPAPPPAKSKPTVPAGKAAPPESDLASFLDEDEAPKPAKKKP